jgi:hypothetical protein
LHQLVIKHFYGEEVLIEAYNINFIIEHIDNNGYVCTYENLALASKPLNTAKGFTYDKDRVAYIDRFSINFTKDRATEEYQISIAFNIAANYVINDKIIPIHVLYLKYGSDYKTTFLDAQSILNDLATSKHLSLANTRASKVCYRPVEIIRLSEEELKRGIINRDGVIMFIQDHPNVQLIKPAHSKELHTKNEK